MCDSDWQVYGGDNDDDATGKVAEVEDAFEAEMLKELEHRAKQAELDCGIISAGGLTATGRDLGPSGQEKTMGGQRGGSADATRDPPEPTSPSSYDPIYFDSDEDADDEAVSGRRRVLKDDDLLYDPDMDDRDQEWTDRLRKKYLHAKAKKGAAKGSTVPGSRSRALPNSDAVLNCPACFVTLCLDCQKHETYRNQFRAMFVTNCTVYKSVKLTYPAAAKALAGSAKNKSKKQLKRKWQDDDDKAPQGTSGSQGSENRPESSPAEEDEMYHPVKCDQCSTQVAVYDREEVYHFFNVLASHS